MLHITSLTLVVCRKANVGLHKPLNLMSEEDAFTFLATGWTAGELCSIFGRTWGFLYSAKRPGNLKPTHLEPITHLERVPSLRMSGVILPRPHGVHKDSFTFTVTVALNNICIQSYGDSILHEVKNTLCILSHIWVCIATRYGMDGLGIESQWGRDFRTRSDRPCGPPSLLDNGYRVSFPGVKRPTRGLNHSRPSGAEVKERVELYLYSPSGFPRSVLGRTLSLS